MDGPNPTSALASGQPIRSAVTWVKRHWGLLVAIVVPVVTVATIVIPLVADAGTRLTSVDTLQIGDATPTQPESDGVGSQAAVVPTLESQELIGEATTEQFPDSAWRVAANAPWNTFPLDAASYGNNGCTADQLAWLEQWGRRDIADIWNGYLSLTNTAADGAAMSIQNIHSVGIFNEPKSLEVEVYCTVGIGGFSEIIPLRQDLGTDTPAVYDGNFNGIPDGTPATLNISPGQLLQVSMYFTQDPTRTSDFAGSLVGDVVIGDTTTQTTLFDGFTREGVPGISTTALSISTSLLQCGTGSELVDCTIEDFVAQLHADPAYEN